MPIGVKNDLKMLWEVGHANVAEGESLHCSYDNQTCYRALNVPVIFDISSNEGYTSGYQNLTIHGYGFNSENINITVDGVDCVVKNYRIDTVSCEVQPRWAPSDLNQTYMGSHGLRRKFWNQTDLSWNRMSSRAHDSEHLLTSFEIQTNVGDRHGSEIEGWFIAPETASYRFYMSCDDNCNLKMGLNTSDPFTLTDLIDRWSWTYHRNNFKLKTGYHMDYKSYQWVNLTKGEKYYMYTKHYEGTGGDNLALAVEINQTAMTGHHHSIKEV
jgi:hypothetical protein